MVEQLRKNEINEDLYQQMLIWIQARTQILKDLTGLDGKKTAPHFVKFILQNPDFDTLLIMGNSGSGKSQLTGEDHEFLEEFGYPVRIASYGPVRALLVEFFQKESPRWNETEYAFAGYILARWFYAIETEGLLYNHDDLEVVFQGFAELYKHEDLFGKERKQLLQAIFLFLSLDLNGIFLEEKRSDVIISDFPGGWELDRGYLAAALMSAREMSRIFNRNDKRQILSATTYAKVLAPDFATTNFAKAVRREAILSSPGTYRHLRKRLLSLGFDPGPGFDNTEESGRLLAEIIEDMGAITVIGRMEREITEMAIAWFNSGTITEKSAKRAILKDIVLPASIRNRHDSFITKAIMAALEERFIRWFAVIPEQMMVSLNTFKKGGVKADLLRLPKRKRDTLEVKKVVEEQEKKYKRVLFVCINNVGRSQWAEATYNYVTGGKNAISAGTSPGEFFKKYGGDLGDNSPSLMRETEIPIDGHSIKALTTRMLNKVDTVVVLCDPQEFPQNYRDLCQQEGIQVIDHFFENPKGKSRDEQRVLRDQVIEFVKGFAETQKLVCDDNTVEGDENNIN